MNAGRPSRTAEAAAAVRALESLLPEDARLFDDPVAAQFLTPMNRLLLRACAISRPFRDLVERILDRRFPGVPADFICRTRYIDHRLAASLAEGRIERLAILGAGYDTRGLRFTSPRLQVVELDHPATQQRKIAIARKVYPADALARITFVAQKWGRESFNEDTSIERAPTFWIAEGILSYLDRDAVARLFAWVASRSSAGSRIVFTYAHRDFVEGRADSPAARAILGYLQRIGEPFRGGWTPEEMARDCEALGTRIDEDLREEELAARDLAPRGRHLTTVPEFRIASARIAGAGS